MKFFEGTSDILDKCDSLALSVSKKDGKLTVSFLPKSGDKNYSPLNVTGTAQELDDEFFATVKHRMETALTPVSKVDSDAFTESVKEENEAEVKALTKKKPVEKKPAEKKKTAEEKKAEKEKVKAAIAEFAEKISTGVKSGNYDLARDTAVEYRKLGATNSKVDGLIVKLTEWDEKMVNRYMDMGSKNEATSLLQKAMEYNSDQGTIDRLKGVFDKISTGGTPEPKNDGELDLSPAVEVNPEPEPAVEEVVADAKEETQEQEKAPTEASVKADIADGDNDPVIEPSTDLFNSF